MKMLREYDLHMDAGHDDANEEDEEGGNDVAHENYMENTFEYASYSNAWYLIVGSVMIPIFVLYEAKLEVQVSKVPYIF